MKTESKLKAASQFLVILLMLDAAFVSYGQLTSKFVWPAVCAYWIILTLKNLADYLAGRAKCGKTVRAVIDYEDGHRETIDFPDRKAYSEFLEWYVDGIHSHAEEIQKGDKS